MTNGRIIFLSYKMVEQANRQYWPLSEPLNYTKITADARQFSEEGKEKVYSAATSLLQNESVTAFRDFASGEIDLSINYDEDAQMAMDAYIDTLFHLRDLPSDPTESAIIEKANDIVLKSLTALAQINKAEKPELARILTDGQTKTTEDFNSQNLLNYVPKELRPSVIGQIRAKEDFVEVIKLISA